MASGFSGGGSGSLFGLPPAVSSWYYGPTSIGGSLGQYIQEAQLGDFLYSWGGPEPKTQPIQITTSRELPGSTHWDPAPVPVGKKNSGGTFGESVLDVAGDILSSVVISGVLPDFVNEGQPPVVYVPPPILLPGQVDPGREEQENEEMAHTWSHLVGQVFGVDNPLDAVVQGTGLGFSGPSGGTGAATGAVVPADAGGTMYTGSCPPRKTRTLTIDCATGQEVKRTRRRRRKLLTEGDMGVLFQIATLPNNANVRTALARAVRR